MTSRTYIDVVQQGYLWGLLINEQGVERLFEVDEVDLDEPLTGTRRNVLDLVRVFIKTHGDELLGQIGIVDLCQLSQPDFIDQLLNWYRQTKSNVWQQLVEGLAATVMEFLLMPDEVVLGLAGLEIYHRKSSDTVLQEEPRIIVRRHRSPSDLDEDARRKLKAINRWECESRAHMHDRVYR